MELVKSRFLRWITITNEHKGWGISDIIENWEAIFVGGIVKDSEVQNLAPLVQCIKKFSVDGMLRNAGPAGIRWILYDDEGSFLAHFSRPMSIKIWMR